MPDKSLDELWNEIASIAYSHSGGPELIFRGATDENHALIPSLGRDTKENTGGDIQSLEENMLTEFKRLTVPILQKPPQKDFEWLFLAQHYGLPTRLLDWTSNPLVALFFAVERKDDLNGVLYYLQHAVTDQYHLFDYRTADYNEEARAQPAGIFAIQPNQGKVIFVRPKYSDERYINQRSVLSCPQDPFSPLDLPAISRIVIPSYFKGEIRKRLRVLGVSTSSIYPGLGGVASEIKSMMFNPVSSGRMKIITMRGELKIG
jgi:hypothetical protein